MDTTFAFTLPWLASVVAPACRVTIQRLGNAVAAVSIEALGRTGAPAG